MAKIACIIMMKNESSLLEPFLLYHQRLFGLENIFLFDNGSTDPDTLAVVRGFMDKGLRVSNQFRTTAAFANKGRIVGDLIKTLDLEERYDFFVPLDCDEFVVVRDPDAPSGYTADPERIHAYFDSIGVEEGRVLKVSENLMNIPGRPGAYRLAPYSKTIFPRQSFVETDQGYHTGTSRRAPGYRETRLCYVHFHFRGYEELVRFAQQKLRTRMSDADLADQSALRRFRGAGFHMIGYLTQGPEAYYSQFRTPVGSVQFPEFTDHLSEIGVPLPFSDLVLPPESARHLVIDRLDRDALRGWARNRRNPAEPLWVRFLLDGMPLAEVVCDEPRLDVLASGYETDRVGFSVALAERISDGRTHVLSAEDAAGEPVKLSFRNVEFASLDVGVEALLPIKSHVDGLVGNAVQGWVLTVANGPAGPERLGGGSVLVTRDAQPIAEITADLERADVAAALGAEPGCGFRFVVPDAGMGGTLRLFAMPGLRELHGSPYRLPVVAPPPPAAPAAAIPNFARLEHA